MTRRDWFAVGVRLLGVWVLIAAVDEIRIALAVHFDLLTSSYRGIGAYVLHAVVNVLVGIYLLAGAPQLMSIAFRRNRGPICANCGYDLSGSPDRCPECGSVPVKPEMGSIPTPPRPTRPQ